MRTTLDIEDDVLFAAKAEARHTKRTLGQVLSELARKGLQGAAAAPVRNEEPETAERLRKLGIHVLPRGGHVVTNEMVQRIRDEEGI